MTEQKEQEIVDRIEKRVLEKLEKSVCKEDTQKVLQEPRNKWFRDANGSGTDSLMANALGNSFVAWSAWEQIRRLTCVACGKKYVRQLTEDDHAEEVCEQICQTIYDIAMMRKKANQNVED